MKNLAVIVAWAFAAAFLGATVLGIVPNPLVGENAAAAAGERAKLARPATLFGELP
jgi:hypothetical protein